MRLVAAAHPPGTNLFSSPPPNPRINEPLRRNGPSPSLHLPRKKAPAFPPHPPPPSPPSGPSIAPALRATHSRTKYYKPVPPRGGVIAADAHERRVVVGESGVSYLLPGAPFEFQFSYSETPRASPLAIREPAFLPFGPPTMPRPWTGKAPLKSKKEKELKRQRRVRLVDPLGGKERLDGEAVTDGAGGGKVMEMAKAVTGLVQYPTDGRSRAEILGKPLTRAEVMALVKPHLSHNRQVNLGRDGLTHNMLELIHTHWRRDKVCKVRCRGVPTVDMNNVCRHLEEKTMGKIIYRIGGVVYLFRGRNYDPRTRPRFPIMLWKPATPVYPKLIQEAPGGLTKAEADELRKKGENLLPICKLAKNGIYINLVRNVRDAFEESALVKINCQGLHASDYKKIGAKLKELVPCVLLSFDQEQILMWRGKDWRSRYPESTSSLPRNQTVSSGQSKGIDVGSINKTVTAPKMSSLWQHAIELKKALLLDETALSPDALLEKVEEFESMTQAAEHSYPALISPSKGEANIVLGAQEGLNVVDIARLSADDVSDSLEFLESSLPLGSLPLDSLAKHLKPE